MLSHLLESIELSEALSNTQSTTLNLDIWRVLFVGKDELNQYDQIWKVCRHHEEQQFPIDFEKTTRNGSFAVVEVHASSDQTEIHLELVAILLNPRGKYEDQWDVETWSGDVETSGEQKNRQSRRESIENDFVDVEGQQEAVEKKL
jgi:hypothetical protein